MTRFACCVGLYVVLTGTLVQAEQEALAPAIVDITAAKPNRSVFKAASREKPLVIRSEKEASQHFSKEALATLKKQVDFGKQVVLVFAWRGSGQDRMAYDVAESFPEQIMFRYKRGRTKDLRPHVYAYALRKNVKWSVR